MADEQEWIGVDFDGTLAEHIEGSGVAKLGKPIPEMVTRVKKWLREGKVVKIFTARVGNKPEKEVAEQTEEIQQWCIRHIGTDLPVTATKDYLLRELWDDRAIQVHRNTGRRADGKP